MKSIKRFRTSIGIGVLFIAPLLVLEMSLSRKANTFSQEKGLADIKITSRTKGLVVSNLNRVGTERFLLELENTYPKTITAFRFSFGLIEITEELAYNEKRFILPNTAFAKEYPMQPFSGGDSLTILAVVFEDGTVDGDASAIREIIGIRLGKQRAYEHFLNKVDPLLDSPAPQLMKNLEKIRSEIANLPEDQSMTDYMRRGFKRGKQDLIEELQQAEMDTSHLRPELERLKAYYHDLSQRFRASQPKAPREM